jgi:hypothetical protein
MKEQLKGRIFIEEGEPLSVLSELAREISPDMILPVFADPNQRPRLRLLMKGESVE